MRRILITAHSVFKAGAALRRRAYLAALLASTCSFMSVSTAAAQTPLSVMEMPSAMQDEGEHFAPRGFVSGEDLAPEPGWVSGDEQVVAASLASAQTMLGPEMGYYSDGGYHNAAPMGNACYGPGCDVSMYVNYEAMLLKREGDENFSLSRLNRIEPFDYEFGRFGGRITAGRLFDCHNGVEAVYTGPFKWRRTSDVAGAGNLQSQLVPFGGYTAADISTFNNADQHVQTYEAKLNSYEINRTWWSWDVLQTLVGVRYVNYEEDYAFSTARGGVGNGLLLNSVNNRAVGAQIGAMFMRPASLRTNYGVRGKAALMANFDSSNTFLSNAGTVLLNAGDTSVDVAGLIEMGMFVNYQVVPSVRLTAGYEFLYLPGFATIPGQSPSLVNPSSGTSVENNGDPFFHGATAGVQLLF